MSTAGIVDLVLDQGADFGVQIYWTDSANDAFTVLSPMRMEIRGSGGQTLYTLQTDVQALPDTTPSISYTSDAGLIQLLIPAADTALFPAGEYDYDLFVTYQDNAVTKSARLRRLITGQVSVQGRITRAI